MTNPPEIRLPTPCLVVLVGAAGSGKSTFATRWFAPDEILSSDAYRARVAGDAADQGATRAAFAALHAALAQRLLGAVASGLVTVVDATNVTTRARVAVLARAAAAGVPSTAIVIDLPSRLVIARGAGRRDRVVPEDVVRRQLRDLRSSLARGDAGLAAEGFTDVVRFTSPAVLGAVRVTRDAAPGASRG